jgi:hypothetical protein
LKMQVTQWRKPLIFMLGKFGQSYVRISVVF